MGGGGLFSRPYKIDDGNVLLKNMKTVILRNKNVYQLSVLTSEKLFTS